MTENTPPSFFSRFWEWGTMIFFALLGATYANKFQPIERFLGYEYPTAMFLAVVCMVLVLALIGKGTFRGTWVEVLSTMILSASLGVVAGTFAS